MAPAGTNDWTRLPTTFDGRTCRPFRRRGPHRAPTPSKRRHATTSATARRPASSCRCLCAARLRFPGQPDEDRRSFAAPDRGREGQARRPSRDDQGRQARQRVQHQDVFEPRARLAGRANLQGAADPRDEDAERALWAAVTLHGLYTTAQGIRWPGEPVKILAAPDNHSGAFGQIGVATTAANGSWSATDPPGPSRIIRAVTDGTATILPSSGQVTTIVPARVRLLKVWPGTSRGVAPSISSASCSAATCHPAARSCAYVSATARRTTPMASRNTSWATAASQRSHRSDRETRASIGPIGSRSPRCRWAITRTRLRPASE